VKTELTAPKVLRNWFEQGEDITFWGQKCRTEPALVDMVFGDGGRLAFISPLATRPNYYGILVDSTWTEDHLCDQSERIIQAIEACYGNSESDTDDDGEPLESPWPAWHDGGHGWEFCRDIPKDILKATHADLAGQMKEQNALFIDRERIQPGTLLNHPEFGVVQARLNDELGWHYCRKDVWNDFDADSLGYATDFSSLTLFQAEAEVTHFNNAGIYCSISTPKDAPPNIGLAGRCAVDRFCNILVGTERDHAHRSLRELLSSNDDASDEAALDYVHKDPSLFIKPIPKFDPLGQGADLAWADQSRWYGNWLSKAADAGFPKTVGAMLALGVHPDDPNAFMLRPLIHCYEWNSKPERLAFALSAGADPDSVAQVVRPGGYRSNPSNTLLRECLRRFHIGKESDIEKNVILAKSVELLLAAGARGIDPVPGDFLYDDGHVAVDGKDMDSGIGILMHGMLFPRESVDAIKLVHGLIVKLSAAGGDLNRINNSNQTPPLITSIRANDIATFSLLVNLGASIKDSDLLSNGSNWYQNIGSLFEEAEKAGGQTFKAEVAEVLMRHVVAKNLAETPASRPTPRRKSRTL